MTADERYTRQFWETLAEDRLLVHACTGCGEHFFPPAPVCPHCGSRDVEYVESDGRGRLHAVTHQHVTPPGFPSPTTVGVVDLEAGPRLLVTVAGDPAMGDPVEVRAAPYPDDYDYDRGDLGEFPFLEAVSVEE